MGIIKKNKKGVSLTELMAAIIIIGLASTSITSMVITSAKGQSRAQEYLLANEMAKTYDSMLARDITRTNLQAIDDSLLVNDDPSDKYVVVTQELMQKLTKTSETEYAPVYYYLWGDNANSHFKLNNTTYDSNNVQIKIYVISKGFGYFKTEVTITYNHNTKQVTYSGTHFKE